jgi:hypothetical protein
MLKRSIGEKFNPFPLFAQTGCGQEIGINDCILLETIEVSEMDDGDLFPEGIAEPSFRKPSLKGHLPSLKTRFCSSAGAGILALMAFASGLSMTGPWPPSHAFSLFS